MSRAEDAVMRLYEDASLRGDLTDEPADRLLKWAEEKLIALDETAEDDAAFDAGAEAILASIKKVNRTVGITLAVSDAAGFSAQAAPDEMALVESLIAGIDSAEASEDEDAIVVATASAVEDTPSLEEAEEEPQPDEPIVPTPLDALPRLDIVLNPALTSFFTGQPAPVEAGPSEPASDEPAEADSADEADETDDDDLDE